MGLLVLLVVLLLVGVLVMATKRRRDEAATATGPDSPEAAETPHGPVVAIVVNPTKVPDLDRVKQRADTLAEAHGWRTRWWETTAEDPGTGQTREAVSEGVDLVCALGGDGTVRSVAAGLVSSNTPMGLLPGGTGNLLARNLELPFESLEDCFVIALTGLDRPIDVGHLVVSPHDTQEDPKDYYFLVMAGLGFDASVMAEAPEKLKSHLGWFAYVVSGLKQLDGPRFEVRLQTDDRSPARRRVRSIIMGNVGRLQGGVELMPDAEADDGSLDVVVLSPKGLSGWAGVAASILTKSRYGHKRIEHLQCRTLKVDLPSGHRQEVQLDGDPIGPAGAITAAVLPGALKVRMRADVSESGGAHISPAGAAA